MRKIILAVAAVAVLALVALKASGGDDGYVVYAKFSDAGGILKHYNVKIGQVAAGQIESITLDKHDNAVVKMKLDPGAYPIGAGSTAKVRPVNLLGEKYVDLDPGDLRQPVPSGTTIEKSRTAVPVELDDALNTLDPDTRGALRIIINEAGLSMAGRGADFNKTLADLPPALDKAEGVLGEAKAENVKLKGLITQGDRVLATVVPKGNDLGDLVASAGDALQTAAQRRQALGQTVQGAPQALGQLRTTLGRLQAAAGQISPAADDLRRTAPSLAATLDRVPAFADDARATLVEANDVAPALSKLGRRTTPTLRVLRPTLNRLSRFTSDLQPLLNASDQGGGIKAFLGFINGWAGVTDGGDALGHVFRLRTTLDRAAITTALSRYAGIPTPKVGKRSGKAKRGGPGGDAPSAPAPQPERPSASVGGIRIPLPAPVQSTVDGALKGVKGAVKGALGKTRPAPPPPSSGGDASKLLNYLLGS